MVIGGYAVNFHGHHRNTKDIDVWIETGAENAAKVSEALQQFGFNRRAVPASRFRDRGVVHSFGREPFRVGILGNPSGVEFDACHSRRVEADLDGLRVPFISIADLQENKRASARDRDLLDVSELERKSTQGDKREQPRKRRKPRK
jgi:hypothetical protein